MRYYKCMQFIRKTSGVLIGLVIGLGTLYLIFTTYNKDAAIKYAERKMTHHELIKNGDLDIFPEWDEIGQFPPLSEVRYFGQKDGKIFFDVNYKYAQNGLRIEKEIPGTKKTHLILGGCSFVFGAAIQADETLSSQIRRKHDSINVLNFGHAGGGLHTQLRAFDLIDVKKLVPETDGTYVFFFFFDHLARWKASPTYMAWAQPDDIHYEFDKSGKLTHMRLKDYKGWKELTEAREAGLDHVYIRTKSITDDKWSDELLNDFVKGIKELRKKYLALYPKGRFVFSFYPFMSEKEAVRRLVGILEKENIEIYDGVYEFHQHVINSKLPDSSFNVPLDGHPNARFNDFYSDALSRRLNLP